MTTPSSHGPCQNTAAIPNSSLSVIHSLSHIPHGKHQQILQALTSKYISVSSTPHHPLSLPLDQPTSSFAWIFIPAASLFSRLLPLLSAVYSPRSSQRDPIPRRVGHSLVCSLPCSGPLLLREALVLIKTFETLHTPPPASLLLPRFAPLQLLPQGVCFLECSSPSSTHTHRSLLLRTPFLVPYRSAT